MLRPNDDHDTICAIATPQGEGGIGIVRISGKEARKIVQPLYRGKTQWGSIKSHVVHLGEVIDPLNNHVIDEALFLPMFAPNSYTGEDLIEIQAHGNPFLLQKIVSALLSQGARLATPGEFTRRAFLSGRMDLTQAEAVMDIISAKSDTQHQLALSQLRGHLSQKISDLKKRLVSIIAQIESSIDFSDQDIPTISNTEIIQRIQFVIDSIKNLLSRYSLGRQMREGFTVAIVGRPNVGKSSLMNYFLQEDRAIVTPIAGTTRDLLQEPINLDGLSIKLIDTAGYRETDHPIEQEGVRRAELAQQQADIILWMVDASQEPTSEDLCLSQRLFHKKTILLLNKIDLPHRMDKTYISDKYPKYKYLCISVKSEEGLDELQSMLKSALLKNPEKEQPLIALLRHRDALLSAEKSLQTALASIHAGTSWEFPAIDLREAIDSLGLITGETTLDDILDQVFGQFCIGK